MKRVVLTLCTVVVLIWSNLGLASALNANIDGLIPAAGITWYHTQRTVNAPPFQIRMQRTGGSSSFLQLAYYACGQNVVRDYMGYFDVGYTTLQTIRYGKVTPLTFCLSAKGSGDSSFNAYLEWDWDAYPRSPLSEGN